jgi:hypothetical protein
MVWHALGYLVTGQLDRQYLTPLFFFKLAGFEWVRVAPPWAMVGVFLVMAGSAALMALGTLYRWACATFLLAFVYVFLLDGADYQNHLYLIALLAGLLLLVPAHRSFSLFTLRHPEKAVSTVPAWSLWVLRFQLALPYVLGGVAKLNYDWLVRAQPMKLWLQEGTEGGLRLTALTSAWAPYLISWSGAAYDLLIVPALLWRRTRLVAILATLFFHLANSGLFNIGVFPWLMLAATTLFLPPDWPRRLRLWRRRSPVAASGPQPASLRPALSLFLGLWVVLQLLIPFRHLLYPGNVDWTEQSHRFSWRMKLRDKRGEVRFVARDPASGRTFPIEELDAAFTPRQRRMLEHDPDMIRQAAGYLARRLREAGLGRFEVRAVTSISFNGRPSQPLVDPEVDLAATPRSWGPAPWIVPLRENP